MYSIQELISDIGRACLRVSELITRKTEKRITAEAESFLKTRGIESCPSVRVRVAAIDTNEYLPDANEICVSIAKRPSDLRCAYIGAHEATHFLQSSYLRSGVPLPLSEADPFASEDARKILLLDDVFYVSSFAASQGLDARIAYILNASLSVEVMANTMAMQHIACKIRNDRISALDANQIYRFSAEIMRPVFENCKGTTLDDCTAFRKEMLETQIRYADPVKGARVLDLVRLSGGSVNDPESYPWHAYIRMLSDADKALRELQDVSGTKHPYPGTRLDGTELIYHDFRDEDAR